MPSHPRRGPVFVMTSSPSAAPRLSARALALMASSTGLALLLHQPAQAHGLAQTGVAVGALHPLLAADHLLLLIGIGGAAAVLSIDLLLWSLAGAIAGAVFGSFGGTLPGQELLAALAVMAVAALMAGGQRRLQGMSAAVLTVAAALHAGLHGLEAPAGSAVLLWWLGALGASVLVSGGTYLLLRKRPEGWSRGVALLLALGGGLMALAPLTL